MKRRNLLLLLLAMLSVATFAQQKSDQYKPAWMHGDMPQKTNCSYDFSVKTGQGHTLTTARENASLALLGELMTAQGVEASGSTKSELLHKNVNGKVSDEQYLNQEINLTYQNHRYAFRAVDEYWEFTNGVYSYYVLFEVAINPENVSFESVEYTTNYGASAALRSFIVPGWGQMHKRQTAKGIALLGGTVLGAAGIMVSDNLRVSYRNKANKSTNNELRNSYQNKSNTWGNVRNGFIVATSAVYIYNMVDVFASKGAKRYKKRDVALTPYVGVDNSYGLSLTLNF